MTLCFPLSRQEWNVTRLTFEFDPEPYGKERDNAIIKMAHEFGVETTVRNSHTLYTLDRWVEPHGKYTTEENVQHRASVC